MTSDGGFTLPAGTVSMLVAHPAVPGRVLGQAVAAAARAHSGAGLAHRRNGDGSRVAVFARASDAAACALAVQRTLAAEVVPAGIAVHTSQAGLAGHAGYSGQGSTGVPRLPASPGPVRSCCRRHWPGWWPTTCPRARY